MKFRPCIDLKGGAIVQIVGGTLKEDGTDSGAVENFVSSESAAYYAKMYKEAALEGGHVIMLGGGNEELAKEALREYPGGFQVGGGIRPENAIEWLEAGASHVIVTSYVFHDGQLDKSRLEALVSTVGKERLVLDLSCRKKPDGAYYVVTDRWQKFTDLQVDASTLKYLASYCAEFLVHGVDVEGMRLGVDQQLVALVAQSPVPVTYAGGARELADLALVERIGNGRVDLTIGSALDIFGGDVPFAHVLAWHRTRQRVLPDDDTHQDDAGASGLVEPWNTYSS